jgi:hypothetical protein
MTANLGYAKLFQKVGLWNETSCSISAMTGISGGTWFFTQFMFSQPYFDIVRNGNQNDIYQLVVKWMNSFIQYEEDLPKLSAPLCNLISPLGLHDNLESISILCRTIFGLNGDFALFLDGMFQRVTQEVYNDPTFVKRQLKSENRLKPFQNTELLTISGLSASAIVYKDRFIHRWFQSDTITYIAPNQNISSSSVLKNQIYTVPLPMVHVVKTGIDPNSSSFFVYGTELSSLPLYATVVTKANRISRRFHFQNWEHFYFYPGTNGSITTTVRKPKRTSQIEQYILQSPFGGMIPTVSQIHGTTSAALSVASAATPSLLAQFFSTIKFTTQRKLHQRKLVALVNLIYKIKATRGFTVCSQWPNPCTKQDSRFIDGAFVDGLGTYVTLLLERTQVNMRGSWKIST